MPAKVSKGPKDPKCPKCAGAMEPGMVVDRGFYNIAMQPQWQKGGVEFSLKTGLKTSSGPTHRVDSWRCKACGFLESYAN